MDDSLPSDSILSLPDEKGLLYLHVMNLKVVRVGGKAGAVSELVSEINEGISIKKAEPQVNW